jgi:hypothetical protein
VNRREAEVAESTRTVEPAADFNQLTHRVIGAAIEVHRLLGPGFLESVYEEALCIELTLRGLRFARQVPVGVKYKGEPSVRRGSIYWSKTVSCSSSRRWSTLLPFTSRRFFRI